MKVFRTAISAAVALAIGSASAVARDNSYVDPRRIREVQQTLNNRGFHAGPVDGVLNPDTQAALRDFQKSEKLEPTGMLNQQTFAALGAPAEPTVSAERRPPIFIVAIPSRTVREAQQALNQRGFQAGPPDGFISPTTEVALRNFQASENLPATGQVDRRTLDALGIHG